MGNRENGAIPRQRAKDLVIRAHGAETLILDRRTGTAHCLPAEVTRVWDACTGHNTLAQIATAAGVNEPTAANALGQLMELDLLIDQAGLDRRKLLRRGALLAGAGAAAAPVIQSIVAPPPAAAASLAGTMTLSQICVPTNARNFTLTLTGYPPSTGYSGTVAEASSGQFYISVDSTGYGQQQNSGFSIPDGQATVTVSLQYPAYSGTVVKTQKFDCLACSVGGTQSNCTLHVGP